MKTINKVITFLLIIGLTGLFSTNAMAQLNEKFKKQADKEIKENEEKSGSMVDKVKEETAPTEKKAPVKVQKEEEVEEIAEPDPVFTPQVYTYNHTTSVQAKETQLMKKGELKSAVANAEAKITEAREKIDAAKEALEKDRKAKKIKETEYYKRMDKIMKAEKWVNDLELQAQNGKDMSAE